MKKKSKVLVVLMFRNAGLVNGTALSYHWLEHKSHYMKKKKERLEIYVLTNEKEAGDSKKTIYLQFHRSLCWMAATARHNVTLTSEREIYRYRWSLTVDQPSWELFFSLKKVLINSYRQSLFPIHCISNLR